MAINYAILRGYDISPKLTKHNHGKEKKDSYFNLLLRSHFIDLLKIVLGSNSISNYLLSKKISTQKC